MPTMTNNELAQALEEIADEIQMRWGRNSKSPVIRAAAEAIRVVKTPAPRKTTKKDADDD